jgi:folate-binding protein YgfZ
MRLPGNGLSLLSKKLIQINGVDATKFLNGLVTSRFLPTIDKKKQHTISESDKQHADLSHLIDIQTNWGLMHEDIYDPDHRISIRRDGIYSMFLNSKGRIVLDCFLYANRFHNDDLQLVPNYLIEVNSKIASQLQAILNLHKLSTKVGISVKPLHSYYYYNDTVQFDQWLDYVQATYFNTADPVNGLQMANSFIRDEVMFKKPFGESIVGFAIDNRIPNFGVKFVTTEEITEPIFSENFPFEQSFVPEATVTQRRFVNGLFEIGDAPRGMSLLPFESNLDFTNGLSLEKGCYVGQELTIRTFNNGTTRKRVVPVQFFDMIDDLQQVTSQDYITLDVQAPVVQDLQGLESPESLLITPLFEREEKQQPKDIVASPFGNSKPVRQRKTTSGKLLSIQDNLGFVLINLNDVESNKLFKIEIPGENGPKQIGIRVFEPDWWPQDEEE